LLLQPHATGGNNPRNTTTTTTKLLCEFCTTTFCWRRWRFSAILLKNQGNLFIDVFRQVQKDKMEREICAPPSNPARYVSLWRQRAPLTCVGVVFLESSLVVELFGIRFVKSSLTCCSCVDDVIAPVSDSCCSCVVAATLWQTLSACSFEAEYLS